MSARTITIPGFVMYDSEYATTHPYRWLKGEPADYGDEYQRRAVALLPLTFDLPEGFDPRSKEIDVLQAKKRAAQAAFAATVTEIERRISELQAIEFSPELQS